MDLQDTGHEVVGRKLTIPRFILQVPSHTAHDMYSQLAGRDLDSILPRSIAPNRHGGPWNEYKYNESDVANLSVRLNRETFTDVSANAPLAPRLGPEIKRDDAMSEFRACGLVDSPSSTLSDDRFLLA